jgi:hypothetical protein
VQVSLCFSHSRQARFFESSLALFFSSLLNSLAFDVLHFVRDDKNIEQTRNFSYFFKSEDLGFLFLCRSLYGTRSAGPF